MRYIMSMVGEMPVVATIKPEHAPVAWVGDKTRVELGLRRLAGPSGSAFGMLPQREQAWLSVKLAY